MITAISVIVSGCTTGANVVNNAGNVPSGTAPVKDNAPSPANNNTAPAARIMWQNTYGGPGDDHGSSVIRTSDGGYALVGSMTLVRDNTSFFYNTTKMFLVKSDASGKELWNKTYANVPGYTDASSAIQTSDGGYAIIGSRSEEILLVKTDANGTEIWNQSYGWTRYNTAHSLVQTSDGGYAITGSTGNTLIESRIILSKIDANGKLVWNKTYGSGIGGSISIGNKAYMPGSGRSIMQTKDGGYVIAGNAGLEPFLLKTDANGTMVWNRSYAPSAGLFPDTPTAMNLLYSSVPTSDGGYALVGTTGTISSNTTKGQQNSSSIKDASFTIDSRIFLIKTDANGSQEWCKTYGTAGDYEGSSVVQADDGGYAILGDWNNITTVDINLMDLSALAQYKLYLVKTDTNGNEIWDSSYGGNGTTKGLSIAKSGDGGYVLAGSTNSYGKGGNDIYLVKVA